VNDTVVGAGETVSDPVIPGNVVLQPGSTLSTVAGTGTVVGGNVTVGANSTLVVAGVVTSGTYTAVTANEVTGAFGEVVATAADACQEAEVSGTVYTGQTVSVIVVVTGNPCDATGGQQNEGLSTGAIVGIAVGGVVAAALIVVAVYVATKYAQRARTARFNRNLVGTEMANLGPQMA
jgi:hypothetical protein